ncbi:MAG: QueT transporter family protein [Coriobacteriia bacterium]|nr:QueT transporter family protein [Coriobacteriia bacterium]
MRRTTYITQAGVIAAVYAAFTLLILQMPSQLGWGPVQFRVSEAVTVLALITPAAIPGLALGTLAANSFMVTQLGPIALLDVVFGSLATLIGAGWSWRFRERRLLALAGPVLSNALIVPAYLPAMLVGIGFYRIPLLGLDLESSWLAMYAFGVVAVGLGQAIVVYGLGWPLLAALERSGVKGILGG